MVGTERLTVANLASARKRNRQNERNRVRNRARKSRVKTQTRKLNEALHEGNLEQAQEAYRAVTKLMDKVAAKGTLHKNTVARRKSRLARRVNALAAQAKPEG
jgi:small subunit ribosomal protein S20